MKTMMIYTIDGFQYVGCFSGNDVVEIIRNASQETGIDSQNLFPWSTVETFWKWPLDNIKHAVYNRKTRKKDIMKTKFQIIENAKRQARLCFLGMAIPTEVKNIDGEMIQVEKVLKFNRTALKNLGKSKKEKVDPRMVGGEDKMIVKVGKPGSRERVEELAKQYSVVTRHEISPFEDWRWTI